jgi:hypothetical protein
MPTGEILAWGSNQTRPKEFIPGSPLIVCAFEELPVGHRGELLRDPQGKDVQILTVIKREATFEEYLQTVEPRYRWFIKMVADPQARFYEVSTD